MLNSNQMSIPDLLDRLLCGSTIEPEAKKIFAANSRLFKCRAGRSIIELSDAPKGFITVGGIVALSSTTGGTTVHFGAGSILGINSLLTGIHQYSAITCTPCYFIILGEWLRPLSQKFPSILYNLNHQIQIQQSVRDAYFDRLLRASKPARVALALLNIAHAVEAQIIRDDVDYPFEVEWWKSQTNIQKLLCISRPKVHEALNLLNRASVIETYGNSDGRISLPIGLKKDSIAKLEAILDTILHS